MHDYLCSVCVPTGRVSRIEADGIFRQAMRELAREVVDASVREVANWLGDTPAVARNSHIDPRLIGRYESDGHLPAVPQAPVALPATGEAETAVAALLAVSPRPAGVRRRAPGAGGEGAGRGRGGG